MTDRKRIKLYINRLGIDAVENDSESDGIA